MKLSAYIRSKLFRFLEPEIEAAISDRLNVFHEGLIDRDQISPPHPASCIVYSSQADKKRSKPSLRLVSSSHQ